MSLRAGRGSAQTYNRTTTRINDDEAVILPWSANRIRDSRISYLFELQMPLLPGDTKRVVGACFGLGCKAYIADFGKPMVVERCGDDTEGRF